MVRHDLERLAKSVAGFNSRPKPGTSVPGPRRHNLIDPETENRLLHGRSDMSNNGATSDAEPRRRSPEDGSNPMEAIRHKGFVQVPGRQE